MDEGVVSRITVHRPPNMLPSNASSKNMFGDLAVGLVEVVVVEAVVDDVTELVVVVLVAADVVDVVGLGWVVNIDGENVKAAYTPSKATTAIAATANNLFNRIHYWLGFYSNL